MPRTEEALKRSWKHRHQVCANFVTQESLSIIILFTALCFVQTIFVVSKCHIVCERRHKWCKPIIGNCAQRRTLSAPNVFLVKNL